ncbi:MAG TPA: HYR domain-containing protein [Thermoanaerobaculia bacterium]|nr:HYR domain-containing protein [Thermoanaerobaculia bacterium]
MGPKKREILAALVCLLIPTLAFGAISSISPSQINFGEVETFIAINGTDLSGTVSTTVVFTGPAGTIATEPNNASNSLLLVFVPVEVALTAGDYTIDVYAQNATGTIHSGPAAFSVVVPEIESPPLMSAPEVLVVEALSASGANVDYNVTAISIDGLTTYPVTCTPPSGTLFSLGSHDVSCSASNSSGTSTVQFVVRVTDTTPPVLTVPDNIVSTEAVVTFTATAVDNFGGAVTVACTPPSGSTFGTGVTTVNCAATDSFANVAFGSFTVTVTGGAPLLSLPADIVAEATGPNGATVTYEASAIDGTIGCSPASGSLFPLGDTTVTCSATNGFGTTTGTFTVTVQDTTPPVINVSDIIAEATSAAGAIVTFATTATDIVSGTVPLTCTPASGSQFPMGATQVVCSAADAAGLTADATFFVTVVDTTPPDITVTDITAEATSAAGAAVTFAPTATDIVSGSVAVVCTPPSGSTFALGATTVNCSAADAAGNVGTASFTVTVVDTTPPVISGADDITAEATGPDGATVTFSPTATDIVSGSVAVLCTPASGSTFALGATTVDCSATDAANNTGTASFTVTVVDTTPPEVTEVKATPGSLWPPNHQMVNIVVTVTATDLTDPSPVSEIVSVSSDQPINGTGDGDTAPDWNITGPLTVELRSERSHGKDRTYTITVATTDLFGNFTLSTVQVKVTQQPSSKKRAVSP